MAHEAFVHRHLHLNILHLSQATLGWLAHEPRAGLDASDCLDGMGVMIHVPENETQPEDPAWLHIPDDLQDLFRHARKLGCRIIILGPGPDLDLNLRVFNAS